MKVYFYFFFIFFLLLNCKTENKKQAIVNLDSIDINETNQVVFTLDTIGEGLPIFYNMYLSVELSSLFQTAGAVFDISILNSTEKTSEYITSYKKAMNLGVYAVDLSYSRVFEQMEIAGWYLRSMQVLSEDIGIPDEYFYNSIQRFEKNINDKDSLIKIANEVYTTTDNYLKENERFATASFIVLGGWVEALHIAINIAQETKDIEIFERIAEQKYSLNNLLLMLSDYHDNEIISEYIKKLSFVKNEFDDFEININPDLIRDTNYKSQVTKEYLIKINRIKNQLSNIRNDIIN